MADDARAYDGELIQKMCLIANKKEFKQGELNET